MSDNDQLSSFIRTTFRSIWSLELLLHLRRDEDRSWSPEDLISALRASDAIVSQSIESLVAAGLVITEADRSARFAPASPDLAALAGATAELYATSPGAVRRMIISASHGGLTAFADAFRLRKE